MLMLPGAYPYAPGSIPLCSCSREHTLSLACAYDHAPGSICACSYASESICACAYANSPMLLESQAYDYMLMLCLHTVAHRTRACSGRSVTATDPLGTNRFFTPSPPLQSSSSPSSSSYHHPSSSLQWRRRCHNHNFVFFKLGFFEISFLHKNHNFEI